MSRPEAPNHALRLTALGLVILTLFSLLLSRLWFLQVLAGDRFAAASERNRVRIVAVEAPRGRILDRNGKVIVKNRPSLAIGIRRDDFPRERRQRARIQRRLAALLGMEVRDIQRRLRDRRASPYTPVVIKKDVPPEAMFAVRERQEEFPGVETMTLPVREYPMGRLASHVLGYVGEIDERELERRRPEGYRLGDSIGKTGIERAHERWLRGVPGLEKLEVDASGRVLRSLGRREPVPGADLYLTIDADVQRVAEESLRDGIRRARAQVFHETGRRFRAPAGATVVLDPRDGGVIAMASYPTYDPRRFVGGVDGEYWRGLNDPGSDFPLLNRAIQASYPPGSTIKPMIAIAALESGVADVERRYPCLTAYRFGDRIFRNWQPRNESITIAQALIESCDTVFYEFGVRWWLAERRAERAGKRINEVMQGWTRRFGFDRVTGVDLPQEAAGNVPDRAKRRSAWTRLRESWCERARRSNSAVFEDLCERGWMWRGGDAVNMSIGQGELQSTPLQLANAYAAVANGGRLLRPHIVRRIDPIEGRDRKVATKVVRKLRLDPRHLDYVRSALAQVSESGTGAYPYRGWPFSVTKAASKTGSAEIVGKQPFSWFASYAPAFDARYVAVSVVEEAGFGSQVSGPVVRRTMDKLFGLPLTPVVFGGRSD